MKILFFTHFYSPEGNAPATRVSALAERWVAAGHEVTVVTCPPNVPNGVVYEGYRNARTSEVVNGVRVERVRMFIAPHKGGLNKLRSYGSYFLKALWASLFLPRPDVVIATSPQILAGYVGVWYKRIRRVPLIMEIRDIWPESMVAVGAKVPKIGYRALELIEKAMYRTCDRLVTVGEGYRRRLTEKGVSAEKMDVIMNGTDLAVYSPREKNLELLRKYGLEGRFVVSYIGTVGMACGLEVVFDAAARVPPNVVFVIVGDGAHREKLEAEAKARGLSNVVFTGRQPKSSMPDWVSSSDASLVHLRKTELFTTVMPSKIFESAGCKRPIIMGVDGFAKQLVMDAKAGVDMTPEDPDSLVACVKRLAEDPALCRELGENAYENIAKIHNRDQQAADYESIVKRVVG